MSAVGPLDDLCTKLFPVDDVGYFDLHALHNDGEDIDPNPLPSNLLHTGI